MKRIACPVLTFLISISVVMAQVDSQPQRGRGQRGEQAQSQQRPAGETAQGASVPRTPLPDEKTVVTHHSGRIGNQQMNYTATTGTIIVKAEDGTPKASFFYVAYTKDDADTTKRPISYVYNGGPGSASLFTHMGLGPKRIVLTDDGHGMPAPYTIADNESSFFDTTDMVFVDAISTGYSRPAPGENTSQFYGIVQDATYFSDFIYQHLTRNERWASPKFLIGESYGTTRSAQLASILQQRHQIYLNGIVLVSSVAISALAHKDGSRNCCATSGSLWEDLIHGLPEWILTPQESARNTIRAKPPMKALMWPCSMTTCAATSNGNPTPTTPLQRACNPGTRDSLAP